MKTQNDTHLMSLIELNPVTGATVNHGLKVNRTEVLAPSALIKGNRKSPNPWLYNKVVFNRHLIKDKDMWKREGTYGGSPRPNPTTTFSGPLPDGLSIQIPTLRVAECNNVALERLNEKVRGGLDISIAVAESYATLKMLKSVGKFQRYFSGVGGKRWANEWLELQYGWLPLLSDVYNAAEELIDYNRSRCVIRGRAKFTDQARGIRQISDSFDWTGTGYFAASQVNANYDSFMVTKSQCVVELAEPTSLQRIARWTSLNPLSIAWELTPYSFVADWFLDIGGYLRETETALLFNSTFAGGYRTAILEIEVQEKIDFFDTSNVFFTALSKIKSEANYARLVVNRVVYDSYPLPTLPQIKTDLSWKRLLSAAALLTQFLPKSVKTVTKKRRKPYRPYRGWQLNAL